MEPLYKKYPMWSATAKALDRVTARGDRGACLFMEMGTAKTRLMIHQLERLFQEGNLLTLVVAPIAAMYVWVNEWDKWAKGPITFVDLQELGSTGLELAINLTRDGYPVICLVNYESARMIGHSWVERTKRNGEVVREFKEVGLCLHHINWDICIADEATAIKNNASKVSKFFLRKLRPVSTYIYVLTGTAYTKRPLDVYPIVKFATGTEVMPKTYTAFKSMYAIPHPYIRGAVSGYQNLDDLVQRLSKVAVLLKKEDVVDIPPLTHEVRLIPLSKKSRNLYDELTEDLYAELEMQEKEGLTVTVNHVFSLMRKQLQITGGHIKVDSDDPAIPSETVYIGTEKLDDLLSILEEREDPTIIVTQFNAEEVMIADAIEKKFNFRPRILNGSVKTAAERENMRRCAMNEPVFIVKEQVGCQGIDLRFADLMIFYSHSPNTENYEQMLARNHRGGQTKKVTALHLLCKNTVDLRVMSILKRDLDIAKQIEQDWRALIK